MTKQRKGIILAGGTGTRLFPVTLGISKQLVPVYDKPMIYYPLSVLMLSGIKEILIITTPVDHAQFVRVLGDGSQWGISLQFAIQETPDGLPQAYLIGEQFLDGAPSALILGDNIFYGNGLVELLKNADGHALGVTVFGYRVRDPERYGVFGFDDHGKVVSIVEKPSKPGSNYAITGLYFADETAPDRSRDIRPSARGELEITSLLNSYLEEGVLNVELMGRGFSWLDTGTHASLLNASNFVKTMTERQGLQVGSPDEVAFHQNWISREDLLRRAKKFDKNYYGKYLKQIAQG
ncbi:glucose-1-phosphate thymidylyltransferase, short form [Rhodobacteraceae bacterium HIMB11]|nr:glucose-1-phosphate thymidylyltransferase, short form [Rhodobacteraceae bacterium HIMB11]